MAEKSKKIKVVMAQFSLETHSRGLITVAGMLKNAGMEVVLLGNELPERIISTAVQEDADVIGISTYCGGEVILSEDLMAAAKAKGIKDSTVFLIGGIFPPKDIPVLMKLGYSGAFLTATQEEVVDCINEAVAQKRN
ncbi:cobalamin B12-binding domain-containing protein [Chloroflexota bacterium]